MIRYTDSLAGVEPSDVTEFCDGWSCRPSPERFLASLQGSSHVFLAMDQDRVVGLISAISDGVLFAYIPLLEVVADYRKQGIASELVRLMVDRCKGMYGVDLLCDADLVPFYERFGMQKVAGMCIRNRSALEH